MVCGEGKEWVDTVRMKNQEFESALVELVLTKFKIDCMKNGVWETTFS